MTRRQGALGDLGTCVPIVVGMVQIVGLDAAAVLVSRRPHGRGHGMQRRLLENNDDPIVGAQAAS